MKYFNLFNKILSVAFMLFTLTVLYYYYSEITVVVYTVAGLYLAIIAFMKSKA